MPLKHKHQIDTPPATPDDKELGATEWNDDHRIVESVGFSSAIDAAEDTFLVREADDVLAMRDGTSPQTLRVYNTWSGAGANYERGVLGWVSNVLLLLTGQSGTGSARHFEIGTSGSAEVRLKTNNTNRWAVQSGGALVPSAGAAYNIGLTGGRVLDVHATRYTFPASQSASADANTLDDYEEGSWTPVLGGTGGQSGQTYSVQVGRYVKIGKQVFCQGRITLSAKGTITSALQISGFPFTSENTTNVYGAADITYWGSLGTALVKLSAAIAANSTTATLFGLTAAGTTMNTLTTTDVTDTTDLIFNLSYRSTN